MNFEELLWGVEWDVWQALDVDGDADTGIREFWRKFYLCGIEAIQQIYRKYKKSTNYHDFLGVNYLSGRKIIRYWFSVSECFMPISWLAHSQILWPLFMSDGPKDTESPNVCWYNLLSIDKLHNVLQILWLVFECKHHTYLVP